MATELIEPESNVLNLTGLPLEGEKLAMFQRAYEDSQLLKKLFHPDGSIRPEQKFEDQE
tara:strand:+ start:950 stop:1126 length:177 start_codon:yes stop_codon:yes gene_type:complete